LSRIAKTNHIMQHSVEFLAIVDDAKSRITEISVVDSVDRQRAGANLIDVREDSEWQAGHVEGAAHMGRGIIERDIVQKIPDKDAEIILYCGGGYAAENGLH